MKGSKILYGVIALVVVIVIGAVYYFRTPGLYTYTSASTSSSSNLPSSQTTSAASAGYTVSTSNNPAIGTYLVDARGITLYSFGKDTVGSSTSSPVSACTGTCAQIWPPFHASSIVVSSSLNPSDFTTFARPDNTTQTAYKGKPLYLYVADKIPGATLGQGYSNLWYVVAP